MSWIKLFFCVSIIATFVGCSSSQMKQRKEQRESVATSSKIYCDYINGEIFPDIEIKLNLDVANKCKSDGMLSITNYTTPSENKGIMYCCTLSSTATLNESSDKK